MPYLVRRISRAKWDEIEEGEVSADAITNDLKTFKNDLSVWHISDKNELSNAILALVTGAKQTKFSTLNIVLIEERLIQEKELELIESSGDTVIEDFISLHRDIAQLTYTKLGLVKDLILNAIKNNNYNVVTRKQIKDLVKSALEEGYLLKENLNPELIKREKL